MELARAAELLHPFIAPLSPAEGAAVLSKSQLNNISTYIDILLRWNARMNLTAVRDEESIVTRHFGESLFAARHLFPAPNDVGTAALGCPVEQRSTTHDVSSAHLIDVGSGAGFPGLPINIWAPQIHLTLIESNHKKATFLREVIRKLSLTQADVFAGRVQEFAQQGEIVTLRAVERFDDVLPVAAKLTAPGGKLALLIGEQQTKVAKELTTKFTWESPQNIPKSESRVVLLGTKDR